MERKALLAKWADEIKSAEIAPGEMDGTIGFLYAIALEQNAALAALQPDPTPATPPATPATPEAS